MMHSSLSYKRANQDEYLLMVLLGQHRKCFMASKEVKEAFVLESLPLPSNNFPLNQFFKLAKPSNFIITLFYCTTKLGIKRLT